MDPYLEDPELWPDVHHRIISEIQTALTEKLRPRYAARVELRVYLTDQDDPGVQVRVPDVRVERTKHKGGKKIKPASDVALIEPLTIPLLIDEEIEEARLEIRHLETNSLVTVIEVLSPANKVRGSIGRKSFMQKREQILASDDVHWVEIDLLRAGTPSVRNSLLAECDYRILVSRAGTRLNAKCWRASVRQPLPVFGIPLRKPDADLSLDLNAILAAAYDHAGYEMSVDYRREPKPPLERDDWTWAKQLLRQRGMR
jgi:hypothetical protein